MSIIFYTLLLLLLLLLLLIIIHDIYIAHYLIKITHSD